MGGQRSTVAAHPERAQIEARIRKGDPAAHIARDHGLSRQAVSRAKVKVLAKPAGAGDDERAAMLRKVQNLYNGVLGLVQEAHDEKDAGRFLKGISEARKCLTLLSKIVGVLNEAPPPPVAVTVNVNVEELKAVILNALAPHPKAKIDVAAALVEYADSEAGGGE